MRKTKIIGTIGPSSSSYQVLKKMVQAGLNIVRINLSHAVRHEMDILMETIQRIRDELNVPLPVMIDTRGPEIRVKDFENGKAEIKKGQQFIFTGREILGNNHAVSINYPTIVKNIKLNDKILAVNGLMAFKVIDIKGKDIITTALNTGEISNKKSISIPNLMLNIHYLNELDKTDILWGIKHKVDYVAGSFVNSKNDVLALRKFIKDNGGDLKIISKIESVCGINNLDEIIELSDGVMVARGDLGVEVQIEKLPALQRIIIDKAMRAGKVVITATEMLESMIKNKRPTRAEVSDIANAVYQGSSAIMLSGETAVGVYPVESVETMSKVAYEAEKNIDYHNNFVINKCEFNSITDIISHSAVDASFVDKTKALVVFTTTGFSARMISRYRPNVIIIGATPDEDVYRELEMYWGVLPIKTPIYTSTDEMFEIANKIVLDGKYAKVNDTIIVICGTPNQNGGTNLIKIQKVK